MGRSVWVDHVASRRFELLSQVLRAHQLEVKFNEVEESSVVGIRELAGKVSQFQFEGLSKIMDPSQTAGRYLRVNSKEIELFYDADSKHRSQVTLSLNSADTDSATGAKFEEFSDSFWASVNPGLLHQSEFSIFRSRPRPLEGVRIAIDPGHLGSGENGYWDLETGKYIEPDPGRKISESALAQTVSLNLAVKLRELGAQVLVTRPEDHPAQSNEPTRTDVAAYVVLDFLRSFDSGWFDEYLNKNGDIIGLEKSPGFLERLGDEALKKAEKGRVSDYFNRDELSYRAKLINEFGADFSIGVHFDAYDSKLFQTVSDSVRGYVAGNVSPRSFVTAQQRISVLRNWLSPAQWYGSVMLTRELVRGISAAAGVPIRTSETDFGAIRVEDGVYARDLRLNREIKVGYFASLEVLNYDFPDEFNALFDPHWTSGALMQSRRIDEIVNGLVEGLLRASFQKISAQKVAKNGL